MKRSKAYRAALELFNPDELHAPLTATRLVKQMGGAKFDPTVEVSMRLGVDPRKADQMVRGTVNLPHGTGKTARVIVFANGDKAEEARAAGADEVGGDELEQPNVQAVGFDLGAAQLDGLSELLDSAEETMSDQPLTHTQTLGDFRLTGGPPHTCHDLDIQRVGQELDEIPLEFFHVDLGKL